MAHWDERPAGAGDRRDSSDLVRPEASRERPPAAEKLANVILSFADWPAFAGRLGLTDQELEFLRLALAGRTAAETASVLGISPEEAGQCQAAVFEHLGVRDDGELVLRIATESLLGGSYGPQAPAASARSSDVPHWDPDRRELWFAGVLIKKFRKPASVQQRILDAFQAAG